MTLQEKILNDLKAITEMTEQEKILDDLKAIIEIAEELKEEVKNGNKLDIAYETLEIYKKLSNLI